MNAGRAMISSIWFDHHWFSRYLVFFLFSPSLLWPYSTKVCNRNIWARTLHDRSWTQKDLPIFQRLLSFETMWYLKEESLRRMLVELRWYSNTNFSRYSASKFHQIHSSLWRFSDNLENFWFLRFQNLMSSDRDGCQ